MRYVLIFILMATVVMAFIFADTFPGLLARYPRLQEANRTVRAWLGMESPYASGLSEEGLIETDRILRRHAPSKDPVNEQDLQEYRE
jgi:hypothetical protein